MEFNNGQISTILVTLIGAILAVVIADPSILQAIMGNSFAQYGAAVIAILIAIYNAYYPRNPGEAVDAA
jgi:hypothetical protein